MSRRSRIAVVLLRTPTIRVEKRPETVAATFPGCTARWAIAADPRTAWNWAGSCSRRATIRDCRTIEIFVANLIPRVPCMPTSAAWSAAANAMAATNVMTCTCGPPLSQSTNRRASPGTSSWGTISRMPRSPIRTTPSREPTRY